MSGVAGATFAIVKACLQLGGGVWVFHTVSSTMLV